MTRFRLHVKPGEPNSSLGGPSDKMLPVEAHEAYSLVTVDREDVGVVLVGKKLSAHLVALSKEHLRGDRGTLKHALMTGERFLQRPQHLGVAVISDDGVHQVLAMIG